MALTKTNLENIVEGILPVANGGTGSTSLSGANLAVTNAANTFTTDQSISGITVGHGGGNVAHNVVVGNTTIPAGATGDYNNAFGWNTLHALTTGASNQAFGNAALYANTTGGSNTAIGETALFSNTTASNNTAVGYQALYSSTVCSANTAFGYQAGYSHNAGAGSYSNTFLGYQSGYAVTSGYVNCFVGYQSGNAVTTGTYNTIIGSYSGNQGGVDIRTGNNNIVLSDGGGNPRFYFDNNGSFAGDWVLNQVSAGYYSDIIYKNQAGAYFRSGATAGASPNFIVYNPSGVGVYLVYGASSWSAASDERLKNITAEISNGLDKVNSLRAAEYTWKSDETNTPQVGLIAQDVQAVLPQAVSEDGNGNLGVRYTEVIPLLVAAIKELKAEFDAYKAEHP